MAGHGKPAGFAASHGHVEVVDRRETDARGGAKMQQHPSRGALDFGIAAKRSGMGQSIDEIGGWRAGDRHAIRQDGRNPLQRIGQLAN